MFNPDNGTVLIPECLGTIDSIKEKVNFESTSCNIGRNLKMMRQDNRVGPKHLIVITEAENLIFSRKTQILVNFFKL